VLIPPHPYSPILHFSLLTSEPPTQLIHTLTPKGIDNPRRAYFTYQEYWNLPIIL
jgi:hypothetical protein